MPRPPSGSPPWKALAVKLPPEMIEELRLYTDRHHVSISQVVREGLDLRLHARQPSSGSPVLPPDTAALLTRLAATLSATADDISRVCDQCASDVAHGSMTGIPVDVLATTATATPAREHTPEPAMQMDVTATGNSNATETATAPEVATLSAPQRTRGRQPGEIRARILTVLHDHPEGLTAKQLRAYLKAEKPIGDVLQGMRKAGVVRTHGSGKATQYVVA